MSGAFGGQASSCYCSLLMLFKITGEILFLKEQFEMNFCPFCGRKIEDSDTFCGFCGKPVEGPPRAFAPIPQTAPQPQAQQPQQPPKRKPIGLIVGISAGAAVLLIGAVLAVVLLVKNYKTDTPDDYEETTVSSSETLETMVPTPTPEPTTTTTTETTPTSSDTPTPTPRPQILRKVKVTDAYNKTHKNVEGYNVTDRVPKITIEGVNTSAINNAIYKKCKSRFKYGGMSYTYYIGKNYISIIIDMGPVMSDPRIEVFIVSRSTGKQLSRSQMLNLLGLTSKKFEARTKKSIAKTLKKCGTYKGFYKKATTKKMLKSAIPCVNSKGKVCFFMRMMPDGCASDCNDHVEPI